MSHHVCLAVSGKYFSLMLNYRVINLLPQKAMTGNSASEEKQIACLYYIFYICYTGYYPQKDRILLRVPPQQLRNLSIYCGKLA